MKKSRLGECKPDLFAVIKAQIAEAEKTGGKLIPLAVGQPSGVAYAGASRAAAKAVRSGGEEMHMYQDAGSPGVPDFAKRFVKCHVDCDLDWHGAQVDFLPLAGIKSSLHMVILASRTPGLRLKVMTMTHPGYGVPATWCRQYLPDFIDHFESVTNPGNKFLFNPETDLWSLDEGLLMVNYPHAPSGQIATRAWWKGVCDVCQRKQIRIFNDAAYSVLAHDRAHSALADVAVNYPELSWAEAFSASKALGNTTGWRVGALVGSRDFVEDIRTVKTSDDAGFVAFAAAGVISAFEQHFEWIVENRRKYELRLELLIDCLQSQGMRLALVPKAGFFTLWHTPKLAFGQSISSAEQFNYLMLERVRIFGVPFEPYVRYSVAGDIDEHIPQISEAFRKAEVSY